MKFYLKTLGCRTNIAESEALILALNEAGHIFDNDKPDVVVINSCTVTANADRKTRQALRQLQRRFPKAKFFIIGCGARNKNLDWIGVESCPNYEHLVYKMGKSSLKNSSLAPLRTRAHVKIQEGCNNACAYCIIPHVRGKERSVLSEEVLAAVQKHLDRGVKEVVLVGTHIANWGKDFERQKKLSLLVKGILDETDLQFLRLSSLEPQDFDEDFLNIFKEQRVCPYIHIALQSGSDKILKLMNRHYSTKEVFALVKKLRNVRSDIFIAADVIVGFPGEKEREFKETYKLCKKLNLSKLHVFPYSERQGTAAIKLGGQVEKKERKRRSKVLRQLSDELLNTYANSFLSKKLKVLIEEFDGTYLKGTTPNFLKVRVSSDNRNLVGETKKINIEDWNKGLRVLRARLLDENL